MGSDAETDQRTTLATVVSASTMYRVRSDQVNAVLSPESAGINCERGLCCIDRVFWQARFTSVILSHFNSLISSGSEWPLRSVPHIRFGAFAELKKVLEDCTGCVIEAEDW